MTTGFELPTADDLREINGEAPETESPGPFQAGAIQQAASPAIGLDGPLAGDGQPGLDLDEGSEAAEESGAGDPLAADEYGGADFESITMPTTESLQREERPAPQPMNPETELGRRKKLSDSFQVASEFKFSSQAAMVLRNSAMKNLTPEELSRAPEFFRAPTLTQKDTYNIAKRYPKTADLMSDPWVMAMFGNAMDAKAFGDIEKAGARRRGFLDKALDVVRIDNLQEDRVLLEGNLGSLGMLMSDEDRAALERQSAELGAAIEAAGPSPILSLPEEERQAIRDRMAGLDISFNVPFLGIKKDISEPAQAALGPVVETMTDLEYNFVEGGVEGVALKAIEVGAQMAHTITRPEFAAAVGGAALVGSAVPGIGTMTGAGAGAATGFAYVSYLKGVGRGRLAARELGIDPDSGAGAAMSALYGLTESVFELAQGKIMAAPARLFMKKLAANAALETAQDVTRATAGGKLASAAGDFVKSVLAESVFEMGQDQSQILAQDVGTLISNTLQGTDIEYTSLEDRLSQAAGTLVYMLSGGGWVGGIGPAATISTAAPRALLDHGIKVFSKRADVGEAAARNQAAQNTAREVTAAVANADNIKAAPEEAGVVISRLTDGQTVNVQADVLEELRQSTLDELGELDDARFEAEFLDPLGINIYEYYDAVKNGTSLEINVGDIAGVAETPLWQSVIATDDIITAEPANITQNRLDVLEGLENDPFPDEVAGPIPVEQSVTDQIRQSFINAGIAAGPARVASELIGRVTSYGLRAVGADPNVWLAERLRVGTTPAGGPALHQAAMYRAKAETVTDFIEEARQTDPSGKKPYFRFDNVFGDTIVDLGTDQAKHITESHPDFTEWERIPEVIEQGEAIPAGPNRATGTDSVIYTLEDGDSTLVVVAAPNVGGRKKEPRTMVLTAFRDSTAGVNNWVANNKAASPSSVRLSHPDPGSQDVAPSSPGSGNSNISKIENEVKALQKKPESLEQSSGGGPRGLFQGLADGTKLLTMFSQADASTPIHESAHMFISLMKDVLAVAPDQVTDWAAFEQLRNEMDVLAQWAGLENADGDWSYTPTGDPKDSANEKVARAFEAYLMDGKPPVKGLQAVFAKMKDWLGKLYRQASALGVEIGDDVRDVFDRWVATDEELAFDDIRFAEDGGLSPDLEAEIADVREEARAAAERELKSRRLKEYRQMKKQWNGEGRELARQDPRHLLIDRIVAEGGIDPQSLIDTGMESYLSILRKKRRGLVAKPGQGLAYDVMAQMTDQVDSDQFIQDLAATPTQADLVKAYVDEAAAEWGDYFDADSQITDEEIKLRVLEMEAERLQKERAADARAQLAKIKKRLGRPAGLAKYKKSILAGIGARPVDSDSAQNMRDLKLSLQNQAKGARAGFKEGWRRGRVEMAIEYQVRRQIRDEKLKFEKLAKRLLSAQPASFYESRGIDPEYLEQIKGVLGMFGLGPGALAGGPPLSDFLTDLQGRGESPAVAPWIVSGQIPVHQSGKKIGQVKTWRMLDYNQFRDLADAVTNLATLGKARRQMTVNGRVWKIENLAGALATQMKTNTDSKDSPTPLDIIRTKFDDEKSFNRFAENVADAGAGLIKVETMVRVLDGGQIDGLANKAIFGPIRQGWETATKLTEKVAGALDKILDGTIGKKELRRLRGEKIAKPGSLFDGWSRESVLVFVLNTGTERNKNALKGTDLTGRGRFVTDADIQEAREMLTDAELTYIQQVWTFQDVELFPHLDDLTVRNTGVHLPKEQAEAFSVRGVDYTGGYFHLDFDAEISKFAEATQERAQNRDLARGNSVRPSVRSGATIARTGTTYKNLFPNLTIDVLTNSLNENIRDLSFREPLRDVQKLLNQGQVRAGIENSLGRQYFRQMNLWLQDIAAKNQPNGAVMRLVNGLRNNVSLAAMGFKVSVMLAQLTGFFQSVHVLGPKDFARGVAATLRNPVKTWKYIKETSYEMKTRNQTSADRDIAEMLATRGTPFADARARMGTAAMYVTAFLDQVLANATWMGGYLQALDRGRGQADAVYYADAVTRTAQPTGRDIDRSHVMRGAGKGDLGKLFTMFGTFFSGTTSLGWEAKKKAGLEIRRGQYGRAAGTVAGTGLMLYILPAVLEYMIKNGPPEDEEDLRELGKAVIGYAVAGFPIVRDLVGYGIGSTFRYSGSPVFSTAEGLAKAAGNGVPETYGEMTQLVNAVGALTGLPSSQVNVFRAGLEEWDHSAGDGENVYHLFVRRPFDK